MKTARKPKRLRQHQKAQNAKPFDVNEAVASLNEFMFGTRNVMHRYGVGYCDLRGRPLPGGYG